MPVHMLEFVYTEGTKLAIAIEIFPIYGNGISIPGKMESGGAYPIETIAQSA